MWGSASAARGFAALVIILMTSGFVLAKENGGAQWVRLDSGLRDQVGPYASQTRVKDRVATFRLADSGAPIEDAVACEADDAAAGKSISQGAAWLYEEFARGRLADFSYGKEADEKELQDAIWCLEGERIPNGDNRFLAMAIRKFDSLDNAMAPCSDSAVKVAVVSPGAESGRQLFDKESPVYGKGPSDCPPERVLFLSDKGQVADQPDFVSGFGGSVIGGGGIVGSGGGSMGSGASSPSSPTFVASTNPAAQQSSHSPLRGTDANPSNGGRRTHVGLGQTPRRPANTPTVQLPPVSRVAEPVPDGGDSLMLLATGLVALFLVELSRRSLGRRIPQ